MCSCFLFIFLKNLLGFKVDIPMDLGESEMIN